MCIATLCCEAELKLKDWLPENWETMVTTFLKSINISSLHFLEKKMINMKNLIYVVVFIETLKVYCTLI